MRVRFARLLVLICCVSQVAAQQGDRLEGRAWASRSPVIGQHGMAATSHPLASQIAVDILKKGGSAVDAAIAAHAALGLMEPMMSGIGGDAFVILWDPGTRRLHGYNGSGRSSSSLSLARMQEIAGADGIPLRGALSVTVPGAVDAWFALHERFGKLPMAELLAPSVAYANEGFPVTQQISRYWRDAQLPEVDQRTIAEGNLGNFRAVYLPGGRAPSEGEIFKNPALGRAYTHLAQGGRDAFYRGPLADAIDRYMKRIGGYLRRTDLESHTGDWVEPVSTNYRGIDVYELPPNGQGVVALQILNILEGFEVAGMDRFGPEFAHLFD